MAATDKIFHLDELSAKQQLEADRRRLQELQIIRHELQSLRKGSRVFTRIGSANVFLLASHDNTLSDIEKELNSLSCTNIR